MNALKKFGGHGPVGSPGYAYAANIVDNVIV